MRPAVAFALSLLALGGCGRERSPEPRVAEPRVAEPAKQAFFGDPFQPASQRFLCDPATSTVEEASASPAPDDAARAAARSAAEAKALASAKGRVVREGDLLTVSGARFKDDREEGDGWVLHRYVGRLPNLRLDVVQGEHWEWDAWTLVDARGAKVTLNGPPTASPDGRAFMASGDDLEGESLNGVQIADYRDGAFSLVELQAQAPCHPRWIDKDTLELKVLADAAQRPSDWKTVRIVRDGKGWKLVQPAG